MTEYNNPAAADILIDFILKRQRSSREQLNLQDVPETYKLAVFKKQLEFVTLQEETTALYLTIMDKAEHELKSSPKGLTPDMTALLDNQVTNLTGYPYLSLLASEMKHTPKKKEIVNKNNEVDLLGLIGKAMRDSSKNIVVGQTSPAVANNLAILVPKSIGAHSLFKETLTELWEPLKAYEAAVRNAKAYSRFVTTLRDGAFTRENTYLNNLEAWKNNVQPYFDFVHRFDELEKTHTTLGEK